MQRQADLQPRLRSEDPQGLGRPAVRLADRRDGAAGDPAARLAGSRLHTAMAADLHRHRQPGTLARPTSIRSASSRRSIRGCPAAAATRLRSLQRGSRRSPRAGRTTCARTRPTTVRSCRSTTASTSTSMRACATACRSRRAPAPDSGSPTTATSRQLRRNRPADSRRQRSAGVQSGQPQLPLRAGNHDAVHGSRHLTDPEDRRAVSGAFQSSPAAAARRTGRYRARSQRSARPAALRQPRRTSR